jgi:phosphomannomutase
MHNTPEVRFAVDAARKFQIPSEILARLEKSNQPDVSINSIDGVRVTSPDGWWLLRASNTEDLLVARAEGFTPEGLQRLTAEIENQLAESGVASPFRAAA